MKQEEFSAIQIVGNEVGHDLVVASNCLASYFDTSKPAVTISDVNSQAAFFEVLRLNKVARIADLVLSRHGRLDRKSGLGADLESYHRRTVVMNSTGMSASLKVASALREASIPALAMKGPIQQRRLYSDYFMKPSGDVDILVDAANFAAARNALAEIGYAVAQESRSGWWVRFLGEQHLVASTGLARIKLDLHYRLQQPGSPSPANPSGFVQRRETVSMTGKPIDVMSLADIVLLAAMSAAKALFNREPCAGYVCDLHAGLKLIGKEGHGGLLAHAETVRLEHTLLLGVRAAAVLIGTLPSLLSQSARSMLHNVSNEQLQMMIMAPWMPSLSWPRRREILWELCGRQPVRYAAETAWLMSAEAGRRLLEPEQ